MPGAFKPLAPGPRPLVVPVLVLNHRAIVLDQLRIRLHELDADRGDRPCRIRWQQRAIDRIKPALNAFYH